MRSTCRGCGSTNLETFLDLGDMPLAGGFLSGTSAIADEKMYPLPVHVCGACSLVQILNVIDPNVLFQDYSFSSSTIPPLVKHFDDYASWLVERLGARSVLEFGCNDGVLLEPLARRGVRAYGVDVSHNISELARQKGLSVDAGFFNEEYAIAFRERTGPVDVVTGSNAFAHNDQPEKILEAAKIVLGKGGRLCLEVMYAGDLLETYQWDTLYHEHLTFYSLKTLSVLLDRFGFKVVHAERIPMHGGSLRVVASLDGGAEPEASVPAILAYEEQKRLNEQETWHSFGGFTQRKIEIVQDVLSRLSRDARIWGYGAAGKATMWVNACKLNFLEAVVDASPLRADKLMPGTHTPIVFPEKLRENPPEYIFVTAWNYADHIRAKESWFKGTWVTPLPDMRFF
jgi:SAM-dependent methyltransferase